MPLFLQHTDSSCQWGVWKTDETLDELLAMLPGKDVYLQGMQRFKAEYRRLEWLAVRVLLYTLLGEEKEIAYYPTGKPYLADASASISISHTKGYVAVVLGMPDKEVGIDIEQYGERVRRVAHKFMREDEEASLFRGTEIWSLLLHWSAKETMFKCMNASDVDFREHMRVLPFPVNESGIFSAEEYRTAEKRRFTIHYYLSSDFVLTLSL
ncbi:4'-phosphopantetheinyl transferase superfamily protein [Bacteroides sp. GD17]|jgi:4'-phosphopantetheinyl transferase|uniref:4'-phosphopantetheinyl transferase family protein n=1 Tax=Bacteroides sp. GD17 TaxID=3139826 RepID=UPI0025DDCC0F|nr:4'-phosphopantetheinyl transferase family protein [uncultured Bacteroides sp.]